MRTGNENTICRLQRLAKSLDLTNEDMYMAMGNSVVAGRYCLWDDDTNEDFGNLKTVVAQVRMIYTEARLRGLDAAEITERLIRKANTEAQQ
jgi:hypothetical protein